MRHVRSLLVVGAILAMVVLAPVPARAGGWAVTVLDPLPQPLQAGRGYTVGYWVLQHGSHPYEGDLGQTGLKLVDDQGRVANVQGAALGEPAHFAAAIAISTPGAGGSTASRGSSPSTRAARLTVPRAWRCCGRRPRWRCTATPIGAPSARRASPPWPPTPPCRCPPPPAARTRPARRSWVPTALLLAIVLLLAAAGGALLLGRHRILHGGPWQARIRRR
jgi:hypothetical protein